MTFVVGWMNIFVDCGCNRMDQGHPYAVASGRVPPPGGGTRPKDSAALRFAFSRFALSRFNYRTVSGRNTL